MSNPDNKNATIEYTKFVQSSRHSEMKSIFDTFIPFIQFKECLDKKEKEEQGKILEEKKKKEGENDKILVNDLQKELQINKTQNNSSKKDLNKYSKNPEESQDESEKSENPYDLTKDYDKVFNFNLITEEEKDEFRKGKPLPYLKSNLLNLISKKFLGTTAPPLPLQEQYHFQLINFEFKDLSLINCPKICFQQNVAIFDVNQDSQNLKNSFNNYPNNEEDFVSGINKSLAHSSTGVNNIKNSQYKKKFMKYQSQATSKKNDENDSSNSSSSDDEKDKSKFMDQTTIKQDEDHELVEANTFKKEKMKTNELQYRNTTNLKNFNARPSKILQSEIQLKKQFNFKTEQGKNNKFIKYNQNFISYKPFVKTLNPYSIPDNFPEFGNKIAIPSDDLRKEIFIFDPISIDLNKGALKTFIYEEILKKRARLLFPYRQNFITGIIIKLIQFLFIIKSKIANKKSLKIANQSTNYKKKNGKTKLKEIEGSNIITFSDVKPFMKSKFGHFNMEVFKNAYEKKLQNNEEIKRTKKLNELQRKFLDILQKDDIEHPVNDDEDNLKNEKRRNDANPQDIEKDSKMLLGAVYKPRKKMNYLNGLKMLIKEEATKNKGSNFKYQ